MPDRILTSRAGSLPRPEDLIALNEQRAAGDLPNESEYLSRLRAAVADVVARQRSGLPHGGTLFGAALVAMITRSGLEAAKSGGSTSCLGAISLGSFTWSSSLACSVALCTCVPR